MSKEGKGVEEGQREADVVGKKGTAKQQAWDPTGKETVKYG